MSAEFNQGLLDAALEIGARRADTLRQIRELILAGREAEAMKKLKVHLGITETKKLRLVKSK